MASVGAGCGSGTSRSSIGIGADGVLTSASMIVLLLLRSVRSIDARSKSSQTCFDSLDGVLAACSQSVPCGKPCRLVVRQPHVSLFIFPDKSLDRKINTGGLLVLHEWSATFGVTKDEQFGRAKFQSDFFSIFGVIDASED